MAYTVLYSVFLCRSFAPPFCFSTHSFAVRANSGNIDDTRFPFVKAAARIPEPAVTVASRKGRFIYVNAAN